MPEQWQSISKRKKDEQSSRIPKEWLLRDAFKPTSDVINVLDVPRKCGLLSQKELDITEARDATDLVEKLARGELKSVDVTTAFCKVNIV
jgi:amidase